MGREACPETVEIVVDLCILSLDVVVAGYSSSGVLLVVMTLTYCTERLCVCFPPFPMCCQGNMMERGKVLRQGDLVLVDLTKHHRRMFLFENTIILAKKGKVKHQHHEVAGSEIFDFKQAFKVCWGCGKLGKKTETSIVRQRRKWRRAGLLTESQS